MFSLRNLLGLVLAGTFLIYWPVTSAYYCGYDDFVEGHRAKFEDTETPARIFTTTHFQSNKYRPLGRWTSQVLQNLTPESPFALRMRNILCHLLSAFFLFRVARWIGASERVAVGAAGLYALHPLAHQPVSAALWSLNFGYACAMAALERLLAAYRSRRMGPLLAGSVLAALGLFGYEPAISLYGVFVLFMGWEAWQGRSPEAGWRTFLPRWVGATAAVAVVFVAVRLTFVASPNVLTPPLTIARNVALFLFTMAYPLDLVAMNTWWGTALPNQLLGDKEELVLMGALGVFAALAVVVLLAWQSGALSRVRRAGWDRVPWGVAACVAALAPFVTFSDHPSETYLYFALPWWALVLVWTLADLAPERLFPWLMGALLCLHAAELTARGQRVADCGRVVERIARELPVADWQQGPVAVRLGSDPPMAPRYGIYSYQGLAAIDPGDPYMPAADRFIEMLTGNRQIEVRVSPAPLRECGDGETCFNIDFAGRAQRVTPGTGLRN